MPDPKPCPICGADPLVMEDRCGRGRNCHYISCETRHVPLFFAISYESETDAVARWNDKVDGFRQQQVIIGQ